MENRINLVEILKDCPAGTPLYSLIHGEVEFCNIVTGSGFPIAVVTKQNCYPSFTSDGRYLGDGLDGECILFPSKENRDWSKFQRPFKDGDIIFTHANCLKVGVGNTWISIFQEKRNSDVATYVDYAEDGSDIYLYNEDKALLCMEKDILRQRLATEEEKQKLFDAIKANGYRWNSKAKTLDKLIEPKFKVGDKIIHKTYRHLPFVITEITEQSYKGGTQYEVLFEQQDNFELAPNKFDITTLKPFDKVLARDNDSQKWDAELFSSYNNESKDYHFKLVGACSARYCIPYEGNENLLGTTNDCNDFYKTWE